MERRRNEKGQQTFTKGMGIQQAFEDADIPWYLGGGVTKALMAPTGSALGMGYDAIMGDERTGRNQREWNGWAALDGAMIGAEALGVKGASGLTTSARLALRAKQAKALAETGKASGAGGRRLSKEFAKADKAGKAKVIQDLENPANFKQTNTGKIADVARKHPKKSLAAVGGATAVGGAINDEANSSNPIWDDEDEEWEKDRDPNRINRAGDVDVDDAENTDAEGLGDPEAKQLLQLHNYRARC